MNHSPVRFPRSIADNHRRWLYAIGWILVGSPSIFGPAGAAPIVTGIHTTALAAPPPAITASDPYWRVVALPETPVFLAYEASLFSGRGPSFQVPATWFHGADGFGGAGWIGLRPDTTNSLYPSNVGAQSDYTTIYATTFIASEAGSAAFDLMATADNVLSFFVNGEITGSTTLLPSIIGGTQIGTEQQNLGLLHGFSGVADVLAGENTLYAVVRDRYVLDPVTNIGGYGQTGLLVSSVPEPGALTSLLAGTACLLIGAKWRRVRRPRRRLAEPGQRGPSD